MALGTSQKQLWALNNGELKATGDEFAFGTIRKNVEVYLSEIFAFHGMLFISRLVLSWHFFVGLLTFLTRIVTHIYLKNRSSTS